MIRTYRAADGVRLVADEEGSDDAPAVILMHGGGQTRHSWSRAMQALLRKGYKVINLDLRGHGDSDWSPVGAYSLDDRAADLQAVTAGLRQPFALVGASLGGATAIRAVSRGLTPAGVVLVDIVPHPAKQGIDRIIAFMKGHAEGFASVEEAADAVAAYSKDRPRPPDPGGLRRNLRPAGDGRLRWHWDPRILEIGPEAHHGVVQASARDLGHAGMPVLLVRGLSSDVVDDQGIEAFRDLVPHLEVANVTGAGHMVAGDRNDAFNTAVIDFLDRHLEVEAA